MTHEPHIRAYTEQKWGTIRFDIDNMKNLPWPEAWAYLRDRKGLRGHNIEEALRTAILNRVIPEDEQGEETG